VRVKPSTQIPLLVQMKRITLLVFGLFMSLGLLAQQPAGRGGFDPTKLPKIGVIAGTLVDAESGEPLPYAAVKITHKMDAKYCNRRHDRCQRPVQGGANHLRS
jgi:hypothetical protein